MSGEGDVRRSVVMFARALYDRGLTPGSSGNISVRLPDGSYLITPTDSSMGFIAADEIAKLSADGTHLTGAKPSKEAPLHLAIYEEDAEAGAVVHLHSTYSVAATLVPGIDSKALFPPLTPYQVMKVGQTAVLPYYRPGDFKVADAIRALRGRYKSIMLANHGPVVVGTDLRSAVFAAEELETTAKLYMLTRASGATALTSEQLDELRAHYSCPIAVEEAWVS